MNSQKKLNLNKKSNKKSNKNSNKNSNKKIIKTHKKKIIINKFKNFSKQKGKGKNDVNYNVIAYNIDDPIILSQKLSDFFIGKQKNLNSNNYNIYNDINDEQIKNEFENFFINILKILSKYPFDGNSTLYQHSISFPKESYNSNDIKLLRYSSVENMEHQKCLNEQNQQNITINSEITFYNKEKRKKDHGKLLNILNLLIKTDYGHNYNFYILIIKSRNYYVFTKIKAYLYYGNKC